MPSYGHAFEVIASSKFASKQVVWLLGIGQPPVAVPRMQPPSLMPSPPPAWLVEQRPHSQLPAGQPNRAAIPVGNHAFPNSLDSRHRQSAGFLRLSQVLPKNSMMHLFWWVRFLCAQRNSHQRPCCSCQKSQSFLQCSCSCNRASTHMPWSC